MDSQPMEAVKAFEQCEKNATELGDIWFARECVRAGFSLLVDIGASRAEALDVARRFLFYDPEVPDLESIAGMEAAAGTLDKARDALELAIAKIGDSNRETRERLLRRLRSLGTE